MVRIRFENILYSLPAHNTNSTTPLIAKNICIGDFIFCAVPVSNLFLIEQKDNAIKYYGGKPF